MRQEPPEASRAVQAPTLAVRLAGGAAGGRAAISVPPGGVMPGPMGGPAAGGRGWPSIGARGAVSTGPDGTASTGSGSSTGAAVALWTGAPPKRVEVHAPRARTAHRVAARA